MSPTPSRALIFAAFIHDLVAAYSFNITSPPMQCGQLTIQILDGVGRPPYTAVIAPYGPVVGTMEQRRVIQDQFFSSSATFQLPYPGNSGFVIMVGDADGIGSGGTSIPTTVGASDDTSCLPNSVSNTFLFQIIPISAITQCEPVTLAWNSSAKDRVSIFLVIPGGQSQNISITNVGPQQGSTNGFSWVPNIREGTDVVLIANDDGGIGTGGSINSVVGSNPRNDQSCLKDDSPSSTIGITPAGPSETTSSNGASRNFMSLRSIYNVYPWW